MLKESIRDKSFNFFKFISPTISTWVQRVPQGMPNSIYNRTLKDLGSKPMNYRSIVYVYDWMMKEHQPIGIDYQPIRGDDYIEDSMMQHYMEFNEDCRGESRFWDHSFPQAEFAYNMAHDSTRFPRTQKRIDFVEKSNKYNNS